MVKALSENKVSKIILLGFQGFSQTEIANKLKITQPSVSIHVSKFKFLVEQQGIMAAAEEFGIMDEVAVLYDLAAELKKAKLTPEEAKTGLKMEVLFHEYDIPQEQYGSLIETCDKLKNEDCFNAALELTKLEKGTGLSYAELVNEYKGFTDQLAQAHGNLENITGEISTHIEELADVNKQKKLADQNLKTHMEKLGVDEQRLAMVETLALALKKADISNQELPHFIEKQKLLNKAEISIDVFADVLGKSKVATLGDNGKNLLNLLTECGGLVEAINKQQVKKQLLLNEVSNLEQQANLKGKLEVEIKKLKADKATLEGHITVLEKQEKNHTDRLQKKQLELEQLTGFVEQEQSSLQTLRKNTAVLEKEINEKQDFSDNLDVTINLKQQKVIDLEDQESIHEQLIKDNTALELKISQQQTRWAAFEGFVGMVQSSSMEDLLNKTKVLLNLITQFEPDKESTQFLKNYILKDLAGHGLQILRCTSCHARFTVDKAGPVGIYKCPLELGFSHSVVIEKDADVIIKEAMSPPKPLKMNINVTPIKIQLTQDNKK